METDFNPIAHQDLINSNIGMLPQFGTGIYHTNMLHGVKLPAQPDSDKFVLMKQKDKEERNAFLISLAALGAIATSTALLFKGKMNFKSIGNAIAAPFKWLGGKSTSAVHTVGSKLPSAGNWFKKAGKALLTPFKLLGNGIAAAGRGIGKAGKAVGRTIAAPFKWIGSKFHKTT